MTDYDGLLALVNKRRSCRHFKPDPVPEEYIRKIVDVARLAPSGANSQPWDFVVVKKEDLRRKVYGFIDELGALTRKMELDRDPNRPSSTVGIGTGDRQPPVLIVLVGDPRTIGAYPILGRVERGEWILDASLANAFMCMHLAATSLGLGSGWLTITSHNYVEIRVKDLLQIPQEMVIFDTMTLGFPIAEPAPRKTRAVDDVLHYDGYDMAKYRVNPVGR